MPPDIVSVVERLAGGMISLPYQANRSQSATKIPAGTIRRVYKGWSVSLGIYSIISCTLQFRILQRSLRVVVVIGLFFRSLSMVALEMRCFVIKV